MHTYPHARKWQKHFIFFLINLFIYLGRMGSLLWHAGFSSRGAQVSVVAARGV